MAEPQPLSRRTILMAPAVWAAVAASDVLSAAEPKVAVPKVAEPKAADPKAAAPKTGGPLSDVAGVAPNPPGAKYETSTLRGRVVWQIDALKRKFDVAVDPDAAKSVVCLETRAGELVPIVKDFRGRGFHIDPKLHEFDWELVVRRFPGSPFVQVVRTYVWKEGKRFEFDYWCDICAIPMYELKECECCQGPIRFRFREAGE